MAGRRKVGTSEVRTAREDEHGVFIRINGSVYRPHRVNYQVISTTLVDGRWMDLTEHSEVRAGQTVAARWLTSTPFTVVNGDELWVSHGDGWLGPDVPGGR